MDNNYSPQRKYLFISAAVLVIFIFVLVFLIYLRVLSPTKNNNIAPSPIPLPKDLDVNYSNLNHIIPGKSTIEDVKKTNGDPERISTFGEKTYLYYPTPFKGLSNAVMLKNNVVVYAREHVFANYRGLYDSYTKTFGQPNITSYSIDEDFPWYVFLDSGLAVQSTNNYITGIIYFTPQNKASFMETVANDIGLSEDDPAGNPEVFTEP